MIRPHPSPEDVVTYAQFRRLVPDGQKADLIDGVIYMASPDKPKTNRLNGLLYYVIEGYDNNRRFGGEAFVTRVAFRLTNRRAPEPDVAYVLAERSHLVRENDVLGPPDIAVEIVTRDSQKRDYVDKKLLYEMHGVGEYWIIDPRKRATEFNRLNQGHYEVISLEEGHIFRSQLLPGFWLDVNWLFASPLPEPDDCLRQILAAS